MEQLRRLVDNPPGFWAEFVGAFDDAEPAVQFGGTLDGHTFRLRTIWRNSWATRRPSLVVKGTVEPRGLGARIAATVAPRWDYYVVFVPVAALLAWILWGGGTLVQFRPFLVIGAVALAFSLFFLQGSLGLAEDALRDALRRVDHRGSAGG